MPQPFLQTFPRDHAKDCGIHLPRGRLPVRRHLGRRQLFVLAFLFFSAEVYSMPASRSRSRSPRRTSTLSKPNSRELITIKTEGKESENSASKTTDSSKSNTSSTNTASKPAEKTFRKPSESPSSKGANASNWNASHKTKERKFSGRCRLFVGNLVSCDEKELREMFEKYGEVAEVFVNKEKGFGFVRLVSIETTDFTKHFNRKNLNT